MYQSMVRVLVVDDFDGWRRHVRMAVCGMRSLEIVGEASNGFDAVERAKVLQPDLVVLDVGLPCLSGIEAARQITRVSPKAKIVFLSENRDREVAEEALRTGASVYVVKSNAGSELIPAVGAALEGKPFLSAALSASNNSYAFVER